jgi:hypothetical protein
VWVAGRRWNQIAYIIPHFGHGRNFRSADPHSQSDSIAGECRFAHKLRRSTREMPRTLGALVFKASVNRDGWFSRKFLMV